MVLVVAALYFTVNSVVAGKLTTKASPKFVTYETLEKKLADKVAALVAVSLEEFKSDIEETNNRMTSMQQTMDDINRRLDLIEAQIEN